ncbi:TonB-dependent receptor [Pedobacter sp.]|uniref:TonB-dependent receptor n=1 Tax=Pedobacter sp. TaxID=1411316 RepID=UPI003D7F9EF9
MKLTFVLLITAFLQISTAARAQNISLKEKNASLYQIFEKITKQSGYDFVYLNAMLLNTNAVTINVQNEPLTKVLERIFDGQDLKFMIKNKTVIVQQDKRNAFDNFLDYMKAIKISGKVIDETGRPLIGASVKVKGKTQATVTDSYGAFSLNNVAEDAVITVSFIGYISRDIKVSDKLNVIQLQQDNSKLEDVIVVGYGTTKRKDLTGAVASVEVNEVRDAPFTSLDQALSGKAAGVQVTQGDGSPGGVARIKIRGGTSILGGNDPLYIIDGIQVTIQNRYIESASEVVNPLSGSDNSANSISSSFARGLNSLGGLNINDIESIDILKDASSTAIYGSKAANGVVIITTKKGRYDQKPSIEFNYYTGTSTPRKDKLLDADQYKMIMTEAATNLVNSPAPQFPMGPTNQTALNILNIPGFLGAANTDWLDLVLRNGFIQNADFSVRGGGKASRYYTSLSYTGQTGVIKGTDFSRISGKINLDNNITPKLRTITNIDYGFTVNNITNGAYTQALLAPPTFAPYNEDGSINAFNGSQLGAYASSGLQNPLALISGINKGKNATILGSVSLEYEIAKDLKYRSIGSVNYVSYHQRNYTPSNALIASNAGSASSNNGIASQGQTESVSVFFDNTLSYNKEFNADNRIDVVVGTTWQKDNSSTFQASGQGFPDDFVLNDLSSAAITLPSVAYTNQNSLLSFYARANYALKERYLFTVTGRSDASSKFPSGNRTAIFPSAGIAWRISEESFLKNVSWIDDLKIRASAGYTGTQNIGDHMFRTLYTPVTYNGVNALIPSQLGNNTIKWESTLQKDAGINFSFFKSRLVAEIGIYEKKTTGLLFNQALQPSSSFGSVYANLASIRNRGLEIDVRGDYIRHKNFSWNGAINVSFNRSLVTNINTDFSDPSVSGAYLGNTIIREGKPIGLFYGSQFRGIIKNAEQLAAYKAEFGLAPFISPYLNIGDPMYDINPLGGFPNTSLVVGNAEPKFYGGYTNTLNYKNLSLISLINFTYGGKILYLADIQNQKVTDLSNKNARILGRWTPENADTDRPRVIYAQNGQIGTSSNNLYDASFAKLKSITLSYQLARPFMERLSLQSASIYVSATNLFTVTNYPGPDPEVSNDPYSLINGSSDASMYPTVRQYTIGFRVGF